MSTDWAGQSIPFFFAGWVVPPGTLPTDRGFFNFYPTMYAASSSVCVTEAISAAALAYMANTSSIDHLDRLARESYGRALVSVMSAMGNKKTATSDETLTAISALGVYETISGQMNQDDPIALHRQGLSTILKLRGPSQFRRPLGRSLFIGINKILLWRDLKEGRRPTLAITDWPDGVYSNPAIEFSARLAVRVVDVCGRTREAAEVAHADRDGEWMQSLGALIQDTLDVNQDVQDHLDKQPENLHWWSLPLPWASAPASNSSSSASDSGDSDHGPPSLSRYPSRIDIYPTLTVASHWNTVRGTRLPLFRVFRSLSSLTQQHPFFTFPTLPSSANLHVALTTTINDICASVPFLLGDVNASGTLSDISARMQGGHIVVLMWGLHMLCGIDGLEPGLKAWMIKVLERMGTAGGVKQALILSRLHTQPTVAGTREPT
ncbi:hypothetical protein MMC18_001762 [Xylographa bjoerkii]|nr:hypothetical protein [Xylographa bjoerkii]